jgi:hypothetical protein
MDAEDGEAGDLGEGEDDGDDPFARAEGGADGAVDSGKEAWVLEGRDPTYPEVSHAVDHHKCSVVSHDSQRRAAPRRFAFRADS